MIDSHSQIWTPETIHDIHVRADGGYSLSGFSTFREVPSLDELTFLAAGLTRFPLEGYKERSRTETTIGPRCSKPLAMEVPVYIASSGRFPGSVRAALAVGSSLAHTAFSVGTRLLPEEKKVSRRLIYEVSPEQKGGIPTARTNPGAIQVDIEQMSADRLGECIKALRGTQEHRIPILVRIGAGRVRDEVRASVNAGADGIVLLGLEPAVLSEVGQLGQYCRIPMIAALRLAREALRESRSLGEVSLIAGNGVVTGADAAKAIALGADAVAIKRSALVALGLRSDYSGGKGGLKIGPEKGGERVAKYITAMVMEVALLARSLGKGDVHSLEVEDLAALTLETSLISGVKLAGE